MTKSLTRELARLLEIKRDIVRYNKNRIYYPETGPLRRELYPKHMQVFEHTAIYREICMQAGNGCGKTEGVGAYLVEKHASGIYPDWWPGKVHTQPTDIWVAGDTKETVRDITQTKLIGDVAKVGLDALGTGMIPRHLMVDKNGEFTGKFRQGTNYACDFVRVKHASGGYSTIGFKSFDQRRESFQGTEKHLIWLDEEPPMDIYLECLMRGRTVGGQILLTFTPLSGPTEVVKSFSKAALANEQGASKVLVKCKWSDVPHLTETEKAQMLASCPTYLRAARMDGEAVAGVGRVYPLDEEQFVIPPLKNGIPDHWPRLFAIDCGWRMTAVVWFAHDRDADIIYAYSDYARGEADVAVHASAIKAKGLWIPGVGDVAGASQTTGETFIDLYRNQGLRIKLADKAVDAGIANVFERLTSGRLKIVSTCERLLEEMRTYAYDDKGKIKKEDDHSVDCLRYGTAGIENARLKRVVESMPIMKPVTFGL